MCASGSLCDYPVPYVYTHITSIMYVEIPTHYLWVLMVRCWYFSLVEACCLQIVNLYVPVACIIKFSLVGS